MSFEGVSTKSLTVSSVNSCLKHDEGYTIYSDNTIYTLKTFIINYLCDRYEVDKMNNRELAFLSDIIWMKIGRQKIPEKNMAVPEH